MDELRPLRIILTSIVIAPELRRSLLFTYAVVVMVMAALYVMFWHYPIVSYGDDLILYNPRVFDGPASQFFSQHLFVNGRLSSNVTHLLVALWVRVMDWTPLDFPWLSTRLLSLGLVTLSAVNFLFGWASRIGERGWRPCVLAVGLIAVGYTAHPYVITSLYGYTAFMFVHTLPLFLASVLFLASSPPDASRVWGVTGALLFLYVSLTSEQTITLLPVLAIWAAIDPSMVARNGWRSAVRRGAAVTLLFLISAAVYFSVPSQRARLTIVGAGGEQFDLKRWLTLGHQPVGELLGEIALPPWVGTLSVAIAAALAARVLWHVFSLRGRAWHQRALAGYWAVGFYLTFLASCIHYVMTPYNPPEAAVLPVFFLLLAAFAAVYSVSGPLASLLETSKPARLAGASLAAAGVVAIGLINVPDSISHLGREIGKGSGRSGTYTALLAGIRGDASTRLHLQWCAPYWDSVGGIGSLLDWANATQPATFERIFADGTWMPPGWMTATTLVGFEAIPCSVALPPFSKAARAGEPLELLRSAYHVAETDGKTHGAFWADYGLYSDFRSCSIEVDFNPHPEVSPDLKAHLAGDVEIREQDGHIRASWKIRSMTPNGEGIGFGVAVVTPEGQAVEPAAASLPDSGTAFVVRPAAWPALLRLRIEPFTATYDALHGINFTTMLKPEIRCRP